MNRLHFGLSLSIALVIGACGSDSTPVERVSQVTSQGRDAVDRLKSDDGIATPAFVEGVFNPVFEAIKGLQSDNVTPADREVLIAAQEDLRAMARTLGMPTAQGNFYHTVVTEEIEVGDLEEIGVEETCPLCDLDSCYVEETPIDTADVTPFKAKLACYAAEYAIYLGALGVCQLINDPVKQAACEVGAAIGLTKGNAICKKCKNW